MPESFLKPLLVDKTITAVEISGNNDVLIFHLKDLPPVTVRAEGDCSSETWIESIDTPKALRGKVLDVQNIDMPDLGNIGTSKHPDVECVQYYGLKVVTTRGTTVIDYRNDSNGYYGGYLYLLKTQI